MCSRTGGNSWTWRRSRRTTGAPSSAAWHAVQTVGRCSTTASGVATRCSVSPRWPSCPPGFLPLRWRWLRGRLRAIGSLECGLLLLWLSLVALASRARNSAFFAANFRTCACRAAISASSSAMRSSALMSPCYTRSASPPRQSREILQQVEQQPEDVQRHIVELIKLALEEQEWDALVGTPESQAYLRQLSKEIDEQIATGEVEDGGWEV